MKRLAVVVSGRAQQITEREGWGGRGIGGGGGGLGDKFRIRKLHKAYEKSTSQYTDSHGEIAHKPPASFLALLASLKQAPSVTLDPATTVTVLGDWRQSKQDLQQTDWTTLTDSLTWPAGSSGGRGGGVSDGAVDWRFLRAEGVGWGRDFEAD